MDRRGFLKLTATAFAVAALPAYAVPKSDVVFTEQFDRYWLTYMQTWTMPIKGNIFEYSRMSDQPFDNLPYEHKAYIMNDMKEAFKRAWEQEI